MVFLPFPIIPSVLTDSSHFTWYPVLTGIIALRRSKRAAKRPRQRSPKGESEVEGATLYRPERPGSIGGTGMGLPDMSFTLRQQGLLE